MSSIIRARSGLMGWWEASEVIRGASLDLKVAGPSMLGIRRPDRHALPLATSPTRRQRFTHPPPAGAGSFHGQSSGGALGDTHPMELDHEACYRARSTRDARFDGRMFIAVHTAGVCCRPICAARTPKRENVTFYPTASAAQEAGFRPCLRCRPESSPDLAAWRGTSNTVSRSLALIA